MSTVPTNVVERIQWFSERAALWAANAAALGLTPAQATAMSAKVTAAKAALDAQRAAATEAKGKLVDLRLAVGGMGDLASELIKEIKYKAASGGDAIYALAGLPVPATPAPVPPPGTPADFRVELVPADGTLRLAWKCPNPRNAHGVIYEVERQVGPSGEWRMLGNSGVKRFNDAGVPAGAAQVAYRITAVRTTGRGTPATFTVRFGVGGQGEAIASVVGTAAATPRIAA